MSMEKTHARNYDLARLLRGIHSGSVALPDFQRDYDWGTSDVSSLLATVLSGWPLGSLLLMHDAGTDLFATRPFDEGPELSPEIDFVVLDGQQRLTALYHALYGRGAFRYALRLDLLNEERSIDSIEDCLEVIPVEEWERRYPTPQAQFDAGVLPVTALREPADFFEWRDHGVGTDDASGAKRLTSLYRDFLSGMHRYEVPAVVIDPEIPAAAIARIFERVNRLGMPLGTFDLVVATSFTPTFNLRRKWEEARAEFPRLDAFFGDNGMDLLSVVSLRARNDVRQSAVLGMPGSAVRDGWSRAVEAMDWAVAFASRRLGVWRPDVLPYRAALTVIAGLRCEFESVDEKMLAEWFWLTCFGQRYNVGSNTRSVSDYKELLEGRSPVRGDVLLVHEDLIESNKKQFGTLHRSIQCLVLANDPSDVLTGRPLASDTVMETGTLPDVRFASSFPRNYAPDFPGVPTHLRTLGMVAASPSSARKIPTSSFSDWVRPAASSQMISSDYGNDVEPELVFTERLARILVSLNERAGERVRTVHRAQGDSDEQRRG